MQVAFTPIAQKYFNWSEDGISIFFSVTGVPVIYSNECTVLVLSVFADDHHFSGLVHP